MSGSDQLTKLVGPRAQTALVNSPIFELRWLRVEAHAEGLLLQGSVSSFYHKQVAQELVRAVCRELSCDEDDIPVVNSVNVR